MVKVNRLSILLGALSSFLLIERCIAVSDNPWDDAPDFSNDPFPPYPPLKNPDGSNISTENLRGTRLYGWKGCNVPEQKAIAEAFDDFYKLANPLSSNINWDGRPATDFWGAADGPNRVSDTRRTQIQQIFKAQQQMYAYGWHLPLPGLAWRILWLEVRCSPDGDPENECKDRRPNDGQCGNGREPYHDPAVNADPAVEAYSQSPTNFNHLWYSRTTFCNAFFNLRSLSEAMAYGQSQSAGNRRPLEIWNSRARVFLHETTHLDYFMNAPGSSPLVDDLGIRFKPPGGVVHNEQCYGPRNCKILRNYGLGGEVAFYPQRNADSFAWYAMGEYVLAKTGTYPDLPRPRTVPVEDPVNSGGGDVRAADFDPANSQAQPVEDRVPDSTDDAYVYADGFTIPQCPDNNIGENTANIDKLPYDGTSGSNPPCVDLLCTNPSLEDGDGICTCTGTGVTPTPTYTITPAGGPGNLCPSSTCSATATAGGSKGHLPTNRPLRVMVVGDSISHGQEGDWTWRYRLWEWFRDSTSTAVDFVGPYIGTNELATPQPPQPPRLDSDGPPIDVGPRTRGGYAHGVDPAFDSDHFAVWGRQYAQDVPLIQARVAIYQPDLLLVELGFNDVGWFISDADGTLNSMRQFVRNARNANPNLQFALANIPQRSFIGGRQDLVDKTTRYNSLFPAAVQDLNTDASPVKLVDFAGAYNCQPSGCPSGYDGLHPNALGEYQIARAFSLTLYNDFGLGTGPLDIPGNIPARDVSVPANIAAAPEDMGVAVTWDAVYGIASYGVRYRISGASDWQTASTGAARYDQTYTVAGITWEFQVRCQYGDATQGGSVGPWSGTVSAKSLRNTPPPPNDIQSFATSDGLQVTWGTVNGSFNVQEFAVIIWDRDTPGAFIDTHAVTQSPFRATGLNVGHRYDIWVETWAGPGEGGLPASPPPVVVGGGQPSTPTGLQATNQDPTTVHLTWNAVAGAAAYRVYTNQDQLAGGHKDTTGSVVEATEDTIAYLYPGTWHHQFCVAALNGNQISDQICVTPPVAPGFKI